ncbi:MAG: ABC transporter ATP-binding protein [Burkholderiaceae bacterium]|jgi:branched-chain amino acid transport system ATP-binding protein|nr:ABC transporter ATP-binding protein [Burkholderiaceae bacterium]NCY04441.1 ABC transporter ATP-binding protein [Burkholderiaceae bacterium]NDC49902.1 ABC transporter ATP-binding protein [Burkholderiaceae bacterium]NDI20979.1 ABC transporter ATP-binding protein [Burkholderiaceae bacterium]
MSTAPLLEVRNLKLSYGGITAVKGIDFYINSGELVTLIGANGAGKTTTLKVIAGLLKPSSGSIHFLGSAIGGQPAYELAALGVGLVPEGRGVFARMTILENLQMGAYVRQGSHSAKSIDRDLEVVLETFPRLRERLSQLAGTLSGGEQQMVAIARAMMARPKLLLLDEPSMGLAPLMVETIFGVIQNLNQHGMTILLVEQNARLALSMADRAYVLESGVITLSGTANELLNDDRVREAYLGVDVKTSAT